MLQQVVTYDSMELSVKGGTFSPGLLAVVRLEALCKDTIRVLLLGFLLPGGCLLAARLACQALLLAATAALLGALRRPPVLVRDLLLLCSCMLRLPLLSYLSNSTWCT